MTMGYGCQGNFREDRRQTPGAGFEAVIPNPKLKLLDQVREVMRLRHYSMSTERSYCDWIRRYVKFHEMRSRADLDPAEPKIEAFLSQLAVHGNVAVSTQNQAFNALLFLYQPGSPPATGQHPGDPCHAAPPGADRVNAGRSEKGH